MSVESKLENSIKNDIYKLSCKLKKYQKNMNLDILDIVMI